ncbi:hypothetical protein [Malacoplasma iowae]|uniref:hypothetical protein n=1 Tax=Malacoplasma iowae TaxID=2116 RepID=UPI003872D807|nr:hypothetical protein QX181_00180 [Malacoplasma iowae]
MEKLKNISLKNPDAEFDEHMGYQKLDQYSREVSHNYRKWKTKKTISTNNGKNWY